MSKFKIKPVDDFKLPVSFTQPNGEEAKVVFTVKHKRAKEIGNLFKLDDENRPSDEKFIMDIATGWDLEEEFTADVMRDAVEFFPGMVIEFTRSYLQALAGNRAKN